MSIKQELIRYPPQHLHFAPSSGQVQFSPMNFESMFKEFMRTTTGAKMFDKYSTEGLSSELTSCPFLNFMKCCQGGITSDLIEGTNCFTLIVDIPGVKRENIDIEIESNMLTIRTKKECGGGSGSGAGGSGSGSGVGAGIGGGGMGAGMGGSGKGGRMGGSSSSGQSSSASGGSSSSSASGSSGPCMADQTKDFHYHLKERGDGIYMRTWRIPDNADCQNVSVQYVNGTLNLNFPKLTPGSCFKKITIA